ncbi:uncharacterized protein LOC132274186 [Cornus florida]|uniref:uncharacterized protein LOC132274186 n=1 Tax=Cornus florida TaxID=4283 RepID=UPI002899F19F|nr:uncharacterized protein LOC132274186 [Cornus florida]
MVEKGPYYDDKRLRDAEFKSLEGLPVNKKKKEKVEYKVKSGWNKCSIAKFINTVAKLGDEKRMDVTDIGFGYLLNLQCEHLSTALFDYIIGHLDIKKRCIQLEDNQYLPINAINVHKIFGLPARIMDVPTCQLFKAKWVTEGGYRSRLQVNELIKRVEQCEAGDDFKRAFILFACAAFLTPNGLYSVNVKELKAVHNVHEIKSYNWCTYVLETLMAHLGESEGRGKTKHEYIGCVLFLQLIPLKANVSQSPSSSWSGGEKDNGSSSESEVECCVKEIRNEMEREAENRKMLKREVKKMEKLVRKKSKESGGKPSVSTGDGGVSVEDKDAALNSENEVERETFKSPVNRGEEAECCGTNHGHFSPTSKDILNKDERTELNDVVGMALEENLGTAHITPSSSVIDIASENLHGKGKHVVKKVRRGTRSRKPAPYCFSLWVLRDSKKIKLTPKQKKLFSYAAVQADDQDKGEILVSMYDMHLTRTDIHELFHPNWISNLIVKFWAMLLNEDQGGNVKHYYFDSCAIQFMNQHNVIKYDTTEKRRPFIKKILGTIQTSSCVLQNEFVAVALGEDNWPAYITKTVHKIPLQDDLNTCGVLVMRYIQFWNGTNFNQKFCVNCKPMRSEILVELSDHPRNRVREELYKAAKVEGDD